MIMVDGTASKAVDVSKVMGMPCPVCTTLGIVYKIADATATPQEPIPTTATTLASPAPAPPSPPELAYQLPALASSNRFDQIEVVQRMAAHIGVLLHAPLPDPPQIPQWTLLACPTPTI